MEKMNRAALFSKSDNKNTGNGENNRACRQNKTLI
jgi:hypothetical protein